MDKIAQQSIAKQAALREEELFRLDAEEQMILSKESQTAVNRAAQAAFESSGEVKALLRGMLLVDVLDERRYNEEIRSERQSRIKQRDDAVLRSMKINVQRANLVHEVRTTLMA